LGAEGESEGFVVAFGEGGVDRDDPGGGIAGGSQQCFIALEIRESELRQPMLAGAEEVAEAAQPKVGASDFKPIVGGSEDGEPLGRSASPVDDDAVALLGAAPDASSELVKLR
jgi:hypothetical protein